jgi:hypothetical protein
MSAFRLFVIRFCALVAGVHVAIWTVTGSMWSFSLGMASLACAFINAHLHDN